VSLREKCAKGNPFDLKERNAEGGEKVEKQPSTWFEGRRGKIKSRARPRQGAKAGPEIGESGKKNEEEGAAYNLLENPGRGD